MITIAGVGSVPNDLTLKANEAIERAAVVAVKTRKTAALKAVKKASVSMDDIFERATDFDSLDKLIAERLISLEKSRGSVVYCTDGDGLTDGIFSALKECGASYEIVRGVGVGADCPCEAKLTMTAYRALELKPYIDSGAALEIIEIGDGFLAGELKLYLSEFYEAEKEVVMSRNGKSEKTTLENIDRADKYDITTSLYIDGDGSLGKKRCSFADLLRIMSRLTAPDGCPWDKAQTHESIRSNLIEEAYEAVDAIDSKDTDALREEIGDVLLQAVFHCDMAARTGEFTLNDAVTELCNKLYFRHTHIFGKDKARESEEALKFWENAKAEEKKYVSLYDVLTRLPKGFPSLLKAQKAYKKVVKAGKKDSQNEKPITEAELKTALFELVRRAEKSGIDAETALNKAVEEYIGEFEE